MSREFEREYARVTAKLPLFGPVLESLIKDLLTARDIKFHSVEHRVKSEDSTAVKVARKVTDSGEPRVLESLTDLLGVRIITYFQDEVDAVAALIEEEFLVDAPNTVDKSAALDADRFGYVSVHYVAELGESRIGLAEYRSYAGKGVPEVQIRSILQHAWAEIEHDLGYKAEAVLRTVRRRFSRLAGLLELADDEFVGLRKEVSAHQTAARATIEQGALAIEIDQDSLSAFVQSHPRIGQLDRSIARSMHCILQNRVDDEFMGRQAAQLTELGFANIEELSNYLEREWEVLDRFTHDRLSRMRHTPRSTRTPVPMGISLYYVGLLRHVQEVEAGNNGGLTYSGIGIDSLRRSLAVAKDGGEPLPGVLTPATAPPESAVARDWRLITISRSTARRGKLATDNYSHLV